MDPEIIDLNSPLASVRTPIMIAAEINFFKEQTRKITLINSIEIGRRLKEAKTLLPHGEWGVWLEESVSYSQTTAIRLMRLYDEYGLKQPAVSPGGLPAADAWTQALPKLSYSQALVLIGLPEEERLDFITDLDIDSMSVREMKKAVEQRKEAMAKCGEAQMASAALQQTVAEQAGEISKLTQSNQALKEVAENARMELEKVKKTASYSAVQKMGKRLDEVYYQAKTNKVAFLYDGIEKGIREFIVEMQELAGVASEPHAMYKEKLANLLLNYVMPVIHSDKKEEVEVEEIVVNVTKP